MAAQPRLEWTLTTPGEGLYHHAVLSKEALLVRCSGLPQTQRNPFQWFLDEQYGGCGEKSLKRVPDVGVMLYHRVKATI